MKGAVHQGIAVKKQQQWFLFLDHSLIILWLHPKLPADHFVPDFGNPNHLGVLSIYSR